MEIVKGVDIAQFSSNKLVILLEEKRGNTISNGTNTKELCQTVNDKARMTMVMVPELNC